MKTQKGIWKAGAIGFLAAMLLTGCRSTTTSANTNKTDPQTVDVTTAQAVIRPIPTYIESTGNLVSDEQTDVAPAVAGKITQVNFDIGSYVNQGDVLLRLDDRDARIKLEQSQAQLQQAQSAVMQAEAQVEQQRANLRATEATLGLDQNQRFDVNAVAEVRNAKAGLDLAAVEFNRATRLLESGDLARSIYDQRRMQRDQAQSLYDSALNTARQRYAAIQTAQAQVDTAAAAARAAQSNVGAAQAQVSASQKSVDDTYVRSPISGYVSDKTADPGEYISPNTPNAKIASIVRTSTLRLRIDIPEQAVGKVATGQAISLQVSAYPDRNFAGTVVRMSPSLNATARTLVVEAEVPNSDGILKPGQFATVRITQSKPEPAVMIPVSAVRTDGDVSRVYVIKDGAAREQLVQLGLLENDMIQVKQGVVEGDVVATSNVGALTDGVFVRQG
jgi:RND family efflux transporter MFP subunit